ncbi:MAG: acetyl-CoA carboxylase biotin carboxyl carrier protein [Candidatus Gastranaerophilales bacterium]|nr:acetyl-CoA carboxylase biotin carboxyl carrier protein [Candidatus Gastranaerophilales bacterium]
MKEFETDYIEKVLDIMKNNGLTEVILEEGEKSLIIKGNSFVPVKKQNAAIMQIETPSQNILNPNTEAEIKQENKNNTVPIISDMIGIFYSKPSPEEASFVKVGDEIKAGQVVCIIETIKLVNKITSDFSGKVVEICIENGKPVEYGQVIMYIEKN